MSARDSFPSLNDIQGPKISEPSDDTLVTVYIPCRNYGHYLEQAVRSVHCQLHKNWELFIIDEASDDDTSSVAERCRTFDPERIKVIKNPVPLGLQKIANLILGFAKGRYFMRLDADDWLDEAALLLMVTKLQSSPDLGIVYGNYFYTDQDGHVLGMERRSKFGVEDMSGHLPPHGACTMVTTRALKAVGGYSEDVDAQDGWELWFKLVNRVKVASLEAPLFFYRQHEQSLSRNSSRLLAARSKIFSKIRQGLEGSYSPTCLAVIGARESYPGFEGVPYRMYEGKSLLERAIKSATSASGVSEVMITSGEQSVLDFAENLEIQGLAEKHRRVLRPQEMNSERLPMRGILLHAGQSYYDMHGTYPDIIAFLSLHAPRRRSVHLEKGLDVLRITASDSVVSVIEEREPMFSHGTNGLRLLNPGRLQDLTFDRERLYRFNGALVAAWWEVVSEGDLFGDSVSYIEMSSEDSVQVKRPDDL